MFEGYVSISKKLLTSSNDQLDKMNTIGLQYQYI